MDIVCATVRNSQQVQNVRLSGEKNENDQVQGVKYFEVIGKAPIGQPKT